MRFFPFWILAFESAMITSSAAYTYWVDASCSNRNDWNAYLTEALDMAKKANTRLRRNPDSDYANVFKRVFKVDKTDNKAFDTVTGILGGIGGEWTPGERQASDTRIYCDNDQRWVTQQENGQIRQLEGHTIYWDEDNDMITFQKACDVGANACNYKGRLRESTQNSKRRVITLCDHLFDRPAGLPKKLDDISKERDLATLENGIADLKILISMTIVHEWTHNEPYVREDVNKPNSWGWTNVMAMTAADSLMNADSYNHFALFALLAERGYTLPRPWKNLDSTGGQGAENDAQAGKLKLYKTITKRWLRQLAQHFRA